MEDKKSILVASFDSVDVHHQDNQDPGLLLKNERKTTSENSTTSAATPDDDSVYKVRPLDKEAHRKQYEATKEHMLALYGSAERERQMHRLASSYFRAINFIYLFLPASLITLAGGIIAFLPAPAWLDPINGTNPLAGILGVVATFWQGLAKQLNLQSRADQHQVVAVEMEKMSTILFQIGEWKRCGIVTLQELRDTYRESRKLYMQILQSNESPLPVHIRHAFGLAESRIDNAIDIVYANVDESTRGEARAKLMPLVYDQLYAEITTRARHWWDYLPGFFPFMQWPLYISRGEPAVNCALRKVAWFLILEMNPGKTMGELLDQYEVKGKKIRPCSPDAETAIPLCYALAMKRDLL